MCSFAEFQGTPRMSFPIPQGFRLSGVHCGIKSSSGKLDLSLMVSDVPAAAAGVYTQNLVFAAPVGWDRKLTPSGRIRAIVVNSGNANACTGAQGDRDAAEMARLTAARSRRRARAGARALDRRDWQVPADVKDLGRHRRRSTIAGANRRSALVNAATRDADDRHTP